MATKLQDAVVKVRLDAEGALAELNALLQSTTKLEGAEQKAADTGKKIDEQSKAEQRQAATKQKPSAKFTLPPLTAAGVAGAAPWVGGTARFAVEQIQRFGPAAHGIMGEFAEQGSAEFLNKLPSWLREPIRDAMNEGLKKVTEKALMFVEKWDAWLRAFGGTIDQLKAVGKAQLYLGGAIDADWMWKYAKNEFAWQEASYRMQRAQDMRVTEALGRGGAKSVIQLMRNTLKPE